LHAAGHEIALVLTQPDRPSGRGLRPAASAVKKLAVERGLAVFQPDSLRDERSLDRLAAARPDALVVAAYGLMLPPRALEIAPLGAFNIHASLLPRWRGAAPIQRALLAGDRESGISIMKMDAGLDTGPVLSLHRIPIAEDDDAQTLHDRLAALGAQAIISALVVVAAGRATPIPQPAAGATYARKVEKQEADLDWSRPCVELERAVRALRPSPGARSLLRGEAIKIWRARCVERQGVPGSVLDSGTDGVVIACGEGALQAIELQRPGGVRLAAADFLRGFPIDRGDCFGAPR
jgi:methionyl-tRNA formyltransferase